jgi:hypothetical protein
MTTLLIASSCWFAIALIIFLCTCTVRFWHSVALSLLWPLTLIIGLTLLVIEREARRHDNDYWRY